MKQIAKTGNITVHTDDDGKYRIFSLGNKIGQLALTDEDALKAVAAALEHRAKQLEQ